MFGDGFERAVHADLAYPAAALACLDPRGRTVRCTPCRRTVRQVLSTGAVVYRKLRHGAAGDAAREWHWLQALRALGIPTAAPLFLARVGRTSVLGTAGVPGTSLQALLEREPGRGLRIACEQVAPLVRRLHAAGLVFRDLYANHLQVSGTAVVLLDVERVFRPRWRRRRWLVKDLAGLLASVPASCQLGREPLRFLARACLPELRPQWRSLAAAVAAKAARIRRHMPRYG